MPKLGVECMFRSTDTHARMPMSHGMSNLHKHNGNLPPDRRVAKVSGSTFYCISRRVGMYLRWLLDKTPSCVKNSKDIALMLRYLNKLGDNMFIFTVDATSMNHTVNTEKGIKFLTLEHDNLTLKTEPN